MKRLLYMAAWFFVLSGCGSGHSSDDKNDGGKVITVSIEPLRYITEQIAGEGFRVETLVKKGSSPETYEPTPMQLKGLSESMICFLVGDLGFERGWSDRLAQAAQGVPFVRVSDSIAPVCLEGKTVPDPHVWTSPGNMAVIARSVCASLCQADTARGPQFKRNLQKVTARLQTMQDSIHALLDTASQRSFLIYHPALTYFAQSYGLHQIVIEEDGKEPAPARLAELVQLCKERGVKTVFVQQEFDLANAAMIAKETGTRTVTINPLSYHWEEEMMNIVKTLQEP